MNKEAEIVLDLRDVWLRIPVDTRESRTVKKAIIRSVTGGALKRTKKGTEIEALGGYVLKQAQGASNLIGHNGAGKSTFLRLISGIYHATSGHLMRHALCFL